MPAAASTTHQAEPADWEDLERQPLLGSSVEAPLCSRCLLSLSYRNLWFLIWCSFLIHLVSEDKVNDWGRIVVTLIVADVLYASTCVLGLLNVAISVCQINFRSMTFLSFVGQVLWVGIALSLSWYSLVRIAELHNIENLCLAGRLCPATDDGSLSAFFLSWTIVPIGVFRHLAGPVWRPAYAAVYFASLGHIDSGPLSEPWMWREITIGVSMSIYTYLSWSMIRNYHEDLTSSLLVFCGIGFIILTMIFYATAEPLTWLYAFVVDPWFEIVGAIYHGRNPRLVFEEWISVAVCVWGFFRALTILHISNLMKWDAHNRMEEALKYAMSHPFRAQLDDDFGAESSGSFDRQTSHPSLVRSITTLLVGQPLETLKQKRAKLAERRRAMLRQGPGGAAAMPSMLDISVRRSHLLEDTWKSLSGRPVAELLAKDMAVSFEGEPGLDVGGVQRDWFDSVARALVEGAVSAEADSLLAVSPDKTLMPRTVADDNQDQYRRLMALGHYIALAVCREAPLPLAFNRIACKHFLQVPVNMEDVRQLDPEFYRGRVRQVMKPGGLKEVEEALGEPLFFVSAPTDLRPEPEELKAGGKELIVTEENKAEYIQLLCEAYLCGGIRKEIQCMLQGFWHVLPLELLKQVQVTPPELSVLISGVADVDVQDWRAHSESQPEDGSPVHEWFWEMLEEFDNEKRCMLLQFATGSSRLPPGGFAQLQPAFTVKVTEARVADPEKLPEAHTCVNQLELYEYASKEQLTEKVLLALSAEGFGML